MTNFASHLMIFLFATQILICQSDYSLNVSKAKEFFELGDYKSASEHYSLAFYSIGDKGSAQDRYSAAICFSRLGNKDSAFKNLMRIAEKTDYLECEQLMNDSNFLILTNDDRWNKIISLTCGSNTELNRLLLKIQARDQELRKQIQSIGNSYGFDSDSMRLHWQKINFRDSINLISIDSIFSIHGWPGIDLVGKKGSTAFWLVIQHSELKVQEKYLKALKNAVEKGQADRINLAYLEDRILMRKKLPQKYGTQYMVKDGSKQLYKLKNKKKVNQYRKKIGLPALPSEEIEKSSG